MWKKNIHKQANEWKAEKNKSNFFFDGCVCVLVFLLLFPSISILFNFHLCLPPSLSLFLDPHHYKIISTVKNKKTASMCQK